jgi:SAM-dependent methyltransferase
MATITTKILPERLLNVVKRNRLVYTIARKGRFTLGSWMGSRTVTGISSPVHHNDFMLTSEGSAAIERYHGGAVRFVELLSSALGERGSTWRDIESVLEIGCGYGRIVRELRAVMSPDRIYVTDIIDEAARFTAAEFGVQRIPVIEEAGPEWNDRFELVYLLSVYTHMRRDIVVAHLSRLAQLIKPGGLVVFTVHGEESAATAEQYQQYWLDKAKLLDALRNQGYYYECYPYYDFEYGLSWFTPQAVHTAVAEAAPDLEAVSFHPIAVDEHQDVFVYRKRSLKILPTSVAR